MSILTEYRGLHKRGCNSNVKIIVNGVCLEDVIGGFKTLNIFGRTTNQRLVIEGGADGSVPFIKRNTYAERILRIDFELKTKSNYELMRKCELLNYYLNTNEDVEIKFTDDKYIYYGQVTEIDTLEDTTNWIVSSFKITCSDFKKYGSLMEIKNLQKFNYNYLYPIIPEQIIIRCTRACNQLRLRNANNNKFIQLDGSFNKGDVIEVFPKEQKVKKNGQNYLKYLNITSNLEDFEIRYKDNITTENCTIDIIFREVRI